MQGGSLLLGRAPAISPLTGLESGSTPCCPSGDSRLDDNPGIRAAADRTTTGTCVCKSSKRSERFLPAGGSPKRARGRRGVEHNRYVGGKRGSGLPDELLGAASQDHSSLVLAHGEPHHGRSRRQTRGWSEGPGHVAVAMT